MNVLSNAPKVLCSDANLPPQLGIGAGSAPLEVFHRRRRRSWLEPRLRIATRAILVALSRRRMVGGQEDMIIDVTLDVLKERQCRIPEIQTDEPLQFTPTKKASQDTCNHLDGGWLMHFPTAAAFNSR